MNVPIVFELQALLHHHWDTYQKPHQTTMSYEQEIVVFTLQTWGNGHQWGHPKAKLPQGMFGSL
jgi:hypothetical protein